MSHAKRTTSLNLAAAGFAGLSDAPERIKVRLAERDFDTFLYHHERGHCVEKRDYDGSNHADYYRYRGEIFADVYAAVQSIRNGVPFESIREISDWRAIGTLLNSQAANQAEKHDLKWFWYYTSPSIDGVLRVATEMKGSRIEKLSDDDVFRLSETIVQETILSNADFIKLRYEIQDAKLDSGAILFPSTLPDAIGERIGLAAQRIGVELLPSDFKNKEPTPWPPKP